MTVKEYVNKKRIEAAYAMLQERKKQVIEICFESGFSDLSYFYKVFKKAYGKTPKAFRMGND
jgi:YesN/AraC family two-component response regulator